MVKFDNNPNGIKVAPAPKCKKKAVQEDTTFGGEPATIDVTKIPGVEVVQAIDQDKERSETPVIDEQQATAPPKPPKPKKKKGKPKHNKKKRHHGR